MSSEPFIANTGRLLCAAVALLATACGGGGDPPAAVNAAAPPVAPTPPPAPPALPGPGGLTQLADFPTLGFAYRYTSNSDGSQPEGPALPDSTEVISFSYSATAQSYEIKIPSFERGRLAPKQGGEWGAWYSLSTSPSPTFGVALVRAGSYTSYGWWEDPIYTPVPAQRSHTTGYFAFGVPTEPGDVPVTGNAMYSASGDGATSVPLVSGTKDTIGVWYVSASADLAFDFSTGGLNGNLRLVVNPGGPGHVGYGMFQFAATSYTVAATRFSGKFGMPGGGEDGFFEGQFTGPQASELMVRWLLPQPAAQGGATGSLFGVLVGKRRNN